MAQPKRKKHVRTVVIPPLSSSVPSAEIFDDNKQLTEHAIADLKSGLKSAFWIVMRAIIQSNMDWMAKCILTRQVGEGDAARNLTDEELRKLTDIWNVSKNLLELPEKSIQSLEQG